VPHQQEPDRHAPCETEELNLKNGLQVRQPDHLNPRRIFMAQVSQTMDRLNKSVREGDFTRKIEEQTGKIPSVGFLGLAIGSMVGLAVLAIVSERKEWANFVGLWAPSFLLIGIYNKLVKIEHEQLNKKVA
jgi:hypothetical protein